MLRPAVIPLAAAAASVAAIVASVPEAAADPLAKPTAPAAREHLAAGNKLYRLRELERAIDEYKAGALVEDAPVFHYNLAQCYRQLNRYADAIWHYDRFLERGRPTGEIRAAVEAFRAQMKAELDRPAPLPPSPPVPPTPPAPRVDPAPKPIWRPAPPWYRDASAWTLAAAGLVAGASSAWLVHDAGSLETRADAESMQAAREQLRSLASTRRTYAAIAGLSGAALLVSGIVKLTIRPDGVWVTGRF